VKDIVELLMHWHAGRPKVVVAASLGTDPKTVRKYVAKAEEAGISPGGPPLSQAEWGALVRGWFPELVDARARSLTYASVHEHHDRIEGMLETNTVATVHQRLRDEHGLAVGITSFRRYVWLEFPEQATADKVTVMRPDVEPGEEVQIDYGHLGKWLDPRTGKFRRVWAFVMVLAFSRHMFVRPTFSMSQSEWTAAHVEGFDYFGGVPRRLIPDNLKTGVIKPDIYDPGLNRSYAELAEHYGVLIDPARALKPKDKGAVEAGVLTVERWVLAPLRNRRFFSLADLNQAIATQVAMVNTRPFRGEATSRQDLFDDQERAALRPLPTSRYELAEWKKATVSIDYHLAVDHRFYSVPYQLVRRRLDVRVTTTTIEIFDGHKRVASHLREHGARRYITDPAHMPKSHRAHLEWTPSKLVAWGEAVSSDTGVFVERLLESRPHPEHAYRACLGLKKLERQYGPERLSAACARALAIGSISYSSVKSILAEGLDRLALPGDEATPPPPAHENLRGATYWKEEA